MTDTKNLISLCGRASLDSVSSVALTDQIMQSRSDQRPKQPGNRDRAQRLPAGRQGLERKRNSIKSKFHFQ